MADALVEQILANPDDDAPRLVWADREGGVRGELVVIQCRLARHDAGAPRDRLPRAELGTLLEREAEILRQLHATGDRYERGFAAHADAPDDWLTEDGLERLLERQPLLRSIHLTGTYITSYAYQPTLDWDAFARAAAPRFERLARSGRITELTAIPIHNGGGAYSSYAEELLGLLAASTLAPGLRALRIHAQVEDVRPFERFPALEELWIRPPEPDQLRPFLEARPNLRRLRIQASRRFEQVELLFGSQALGQLEELEVELLSAAGLRTLARSPHLENLERLSLHRSYPDRDVPAHEAVFAAVPGITELSLYEAATDAVVAAVARAPFARNLRVLSMSDGHLTDASVPVLRESFPALERLHLASPHHQGPLRDGLLTVRSAVPLVVV